MKAFLFSYVLFDYILVIFRNGWNYKHNSALYLYTLYSYSYCLSYSDDTRTNILNNITVYSSLCTHLLYDQDIVR
jgi:hypothetical protein